MDKIFRGLKSLLRKRKKVDRKNETHESHALTRAAEGSEKAY